MKAKVILYKSKTLSNGEHPLMLRLSDGAKRKYITLGISLPKKSWNFKKDCYKSTPIPEGASEEQIKKIEKRDAEIRSKISDNENKYIDKIKELAIPGKKVSLDTLQQKVDQPVKNDFTVFQWFDTLIGEYKSLGKIGQVRVYKTALGALKTFLNDKDIAFDEIDLPFLYRYERHLKQRKLKTATFSIYYRTLRAALNKAIREGFAKEYPFKDYKIPKGEPNKRALSVEDMEALIAQNKDDDRFRMILFSYYTCGMNYVDMVRLRWSDIHGAEIRYTRQKIHHKMTIPIHPRVKEILQFYKPIIGKQLQISGLNKKYIFPVLNDEVHITEQQISDRIQKTRKYFNDYLKTIGELAGVEDNLSSYVLRHTAITHLVRKGITIDAIQALAGHARISTTENYFKEANNDQMKRAINEL